MTIIIPPLAMLILKWLAIVLIIVLCVLGIAFIVYMSGVKMWK